MIRLALPEHGNSVPMIKIYGIKNCDTMKKAFAWCEANHISYEFHDYKKQGVPRDKLVLHWCRSARLADAGQQQGPDLAQAHARTAGDHHAKRRRGADDGIFQRDPPPHRRERCRADPGRLRPHPV
jgi:hypothetical protein